MDQTFFIILITLVGPFIGAFLGAYRRLEQKRIAYLLAAAAGVMAYISIFELIPQGLRGHSWYFLMMFLALGMLVMYLLDLLLPHFHHAKHSSGGCPKIEEMAWFLLVGISLHNLPEGMAIGMGGLSDTGFSVFIALAITLHDIPETICIAAPLYAGTGQRFRSFVLAVLSSLTTVIGYLFTRFVLVDSPAWILAAAVSFTAGVMLYITFIEIVPDILRIRQARRSGIILAFGLAALLTFALESLLAVIVGG